jgi:hypothetical protein
MLQEMAQISHILTHISTLRSFPMQAKYDVTNLKRSDVRPTDEL